MALASVAIPKITLRFNIIRIIASAIARNRAFDTSNSST